MKKLAAIVAVGMMVSLGLQAQGLVNFANLGFTPSAPYFGTDGTTKLAGSYMIELWVGPNAGALLPVPGSMQSKNLASGLFNAGQATIPLTQLDGSGKGVASVRIWQAAGGASWAAASSNPGALVGQTGGVNGGTFAISPNLIVAGAPLPPPAALAGQPSITLYAVVPEPSVIALGLLGAAALLLRRRK